MSEVTVGVIALVVLLGLFLTGIELAFCMAIVGFVGFAYLNSFSAACNLLVKDFFDTFTSYSYTVIPLFVLMGQIAQNSNIAKRIYLAAHKWVGHISGGLAMTTVVGATIFKAMCGSTLATGDLFGIAIPEMDRYGYKRNICRGGRGHHRHADPGIVLIIRDRYRTIDGRPSAGIIPGFDIRPVHGGDYCWVRISLRSRRRLKGAHERARAPPSF
jgi:TRAP-type mannitol/chloroaromatic compound transport system permease large subunit